MARESLRKRTSPTTPVTAHPPSPKRAPAKKPATAPQKKAISEQMKTSMPAASRKRKATIDEDSNAGKQKKTAMIVESAVSDIFSPLNMRQLSPSREESPTGSLFIQPKAENECEDEEQDPEKRKAFVLSGYCNPKTARNYPVLWRTRHEICDDDYENFPDNELLFFERKEKYRRIRAKRERQRGLNLL
jgi:hypothetical protein